MISGPINLGGKSHCSECTSSVWKLKGYDNIQDNKEKLMTSRISSTKMKNLRNKDTNETFWTKSAPRTNKDKH